MEVRIAKRVGVDSGGGSIGVWILGSPGIMLRFSVMKRLLKKSSIHKKSIFQVFPVTALDETRPHQLVYVLDVLSRHTTPSTTKKRRNDGCWVSANFPQESLLEPHLIGDLRRHQNRHLRRKLQRHLHRHLKIGSIGPKKKSFSRLDLKRRDVW